MMPVVFPNSGDDKSYPYALTDQPATGRALRFLIVLLVIWIAGRAIANGAFDGDVPNSPMEQMWEDAGYAAAPPGVFEDQSQRAITENPTLLRQQARGNAIFGIKKNDNASDLAFRVLAGSAGAALSADMLASHQSLLWERSTRSFSAHKPLRMLARDSVLGQDFEPGAGVRAANSNAGKRSRRDVLALDSWVFLRSASAASDPKTIGGRAQYGGSQAGAIARYYPWRRSGAPSLFLRGTRSLSGPAQTEFALGAAIRPWRRIPLQLVAEQRLSVNGNGSNKPAAYIVTDIAPQTLAGNVRATAYGQAGFVGIDDSAYFFDLQLVAEKPIVTNGQREVALGAGIWSGGQGPLSSNDNSKIAAVSRVDVGPRLSTRLPIAGQQTQIAFDWRQRVAGNAAPGSGAALTVSTRF